MSLCNIFKNGLCLPNNRREFKYSYHSKHMRGLQFQSNHLLEAKHRVKQLLSKRFCQDHLGNYFGRIWSPWPCAVNTIL